MAGSVNKVVLVGVVGKYGVSLAYGPSGTACASFALLLTEATQDGKYFSTLIPCQVWGKHAEAASELDAGQPVVFEGKLARRRKGEDQWEIVVSGFELTPLDVPTPAGSPA